MKQITDAVVIGSGIVGCATALALTRAGIRRVVIVDKGPLVSGMTRRDPGLIHTFHGHAALVQLARASLEFYRGWASQVGGKSPFVETGLVVPATTAGEHETLKQRVAWDRAAGGNPQLFEGDGIGRDLAGIQTEGWRAAAYWSEAGYADAVQSAQALTAKAKEYGVRTETGTQVRSIALERSSVRAVTTTAGRIETLLVVIAAGGWAGRLLLPLGHTADLKLTRGVIGFFQGPSDASAPLPAVMSARDDSFVRPHPYRMYGAGVRVHNGRLSSIEGLDETVNGHELEEVSAFAHRYVPSLDGTAPRRSHVIVYAEPEDGLPLIGRVPGVDGLYVAAGFGPHSFALAPAVGQAVAQLVVDGSSQIDVSELGPARPFVRRPKPPTGPITKG